MKNKDEIISYTSQPHLKLVGNNECIIDGLKGILEYTKEKIKINLGKNNITLFGDELYIESFSPEGAVVEGTIITLEFESND